MNEDKDWLVYNKNFADNYDDLNYQRGVQNYCMSLSHKLIENRFTTKDYFDKVIEVGSGTGEHLNFVRHGFKEYTMTDFNAKALNVAKSKIDDKRIRYIVQDARELQFPDDTFDRLIGEHVLEHIYEPHIILKEWKRVICNGGVLSIVIPTDPGLMWRFGRRLGPRQALLKKGLPYDYIMAREHVNSCYNLISLLRYYFPNGVENWFPFQIPFLDINLFLGFNVIVEK